jgi:hypothetical protein
MISGEFEETLARYRHILPVRPTQLDNPGPIRLSHPALRERPCTISLVIRGGISDPLKVSDRPH